MKLCVLLIVLSISSPVFSDVECHYNYDCKDKPDDPYICFENKCLEVKTTVGESCEADQQCKFDSHALCLHNEETNAKECLCMVDYAWYKNKCVVDNGFGNTCSIDDDCTSEDLQCVSGTDGVKTCSCETGFKYIESTKKCLPIKQLGEECKFTEQCSGDRVMCKDSSCSCEEGTKVVKDACIIPKDHSEQCKEEECDSDRLLTCRNSSCLCIDRYEYLDGSCKAVGCLTDNQCEEGQICDLNGRCKEIKPEETTEPSGSSEKPKFTMRPEIIAGIAVGSGLVLLLLAFIAFKVKICGGNSRSSSSLLPPMKYDFS